MAEIKEPVIERLSGDYNRGYTKAIMDIQDVFSYIESDLAVHGKRLNMKLAKELLNCILKNREGVRESKRGFIRWNAVKNGFEFFEGTKEWR